MGGGRGMGDEGQKSIHLDLALKGSAIIFKMMM